MFASLYSNEITLPTGERWNPSASYRKHWLSGSYFPSPTHTLSQTNQGGVSLKRVRCQQFCLWFSRFPLLIRVLVSRRNCLLTSDRWWEWGENCRSMSLYRARLPVPLFMDFSGRFSFLLSPLAALPDAVPRQEGIKKNTTWCKASFWIISNFQQSLSHIGVH